jgi:hypothetical protein
VAVQFKATGTPLFKSTGVVAMDPDCCCGGCDFMVTGETFATLSVPVGQRWFAAFPATGARIRNSYRNSYTDYTFSFPVYSIDLVDGYELPIGSFIAREVTFHDSTLVGDVTTATLTAREDFILSLIYRLSPSPGFKFRVSNREVSYTGPTIPDISTFPIGGTSTGTSPTPWVWGTPPITYPDLPVMPYSPTSFPADFETSLVSLGWATAEVSPCV